MLEMYYKYKVNYKSYIVFIKIGSFYEVFDNDALIINKLFKYKIKKIKNNIKVGFPINKLEDILKLINNINYIVIDKENIVDKKECINNKYNEYSFDINKIIFDYIRIDKVYNSLCDKVMNNNIGIILERIEDII